jgi:hypothetical protein
LNPQCFWLLTRIIKNKKQTQCISMNKKVKKQT